MENTPHYPSISQAIWLVILFFLLATALSIPLGIIDGMVDFPLATHPVSLGLINLSAVGLILIAGLKKANAPIEKVFLLGRVRPQLLISMAITIIGVTILLSEVDNLLRTVLPAPPWFSELLMNLVGAQTSLWGSVFVLIIVAPLTEEFLFRGLILRGFLSRYSVRKSILASSLLFAALHLNPWQFIGGTVLGCLFAWWFIRTRSLLPCLFGHALANAQPLIFGAVFDLQIQGYTNPLSDHIEFQPLWFDAVGFVLAGFGLWLLTQMLPSETT